MVWEEQTTNCSVYAIGEIGLFNTLYDKGNTMNDVNPDYVVIGEGKVYFLDTLTKATNLILNGVGDIVKTAQENKNND